MKTKNILIILYVFATVFMITTSVFGQEVKKGDLTKTSGLESVKIKNLEPIERDSDSFMYDDSCNIPCGGIITVIGVQNDLLLVRYDMRYNDIRYGIDDDIDNCGRTDAPCPSGALFFITKEKFSFMHAEYERMQAEKINEKNLVKKLLGK